MLLRNVGKTLRLDSSLNESFNTYIISVGTPLKPINGVSQLNTDFIYSVLDSISRVLSSGNLIILRSTVPIGTCREIVIPYLESKTNKVCGVDFFVAFAPERTEEGNALRELTTLPQIIGGYDEISVLKARKIFERITNNIVVLDSLEEAEMVKLLNNSFRDYVFAFSNQSARIASKYNLDINQVIKAANYKYPRNPIPLPSPGVGGPCLTKDPYIYEKSTSLLNEPLFILSRKENELMPKYVFNLTKERLKYLNKDLKNCKVLCCGLAFKGNPRTGDLRHSTGVEIYNYFAESNVDVYGQDFEADHDEMEYLGINISSIESGFSDADVVLFLNNHTRYRDLAINELCKKSSSEVLLIDCWNLYESNRFDDHIKYSNISKRYF